MIDRLKIADGDLLIIHGNKGMDTDDIRKLGKMVEKWLKSRGLSNVELVATSSDADCVSFSVLSVNDVFEDAVLNGKST
jgi:hypothetical protein